MNTVYLPAIAALAGSAIGGLTSFASAWLTHYRQDRANRLSGEKARRQKLYKQFIAAMHVTLSRSERSNALSYTLVEALLGILGAAETEGTSIVIFRGEGANFCSGFDLGDLKSQSDGDLVYKLLRIELLLQRIANAPFQTLALAQGKVIGAGCDLFCACSERVTVPEATFRMPGWRFGVALGTRRLVQRIGSDAARSVLVESRTLSANEALRIGLATSVAAQDSWNDVITEAVQRSRSLDPHSLELLLALTVADTRDADMRALVDSASRPGLKERIQQYRASEKKRHRSS